jgi:hypothetical protein
VGEEDVGVGLDDEDVDGLHRGGGHVAGPGPRHHQRREALLRQDAGHERAHELLGADQGGEQAQEVDEDGGAHHAADLREAEEEAPGSVWFGSILFGSVRFDASSMYLRTMARLAAGSSTERRMRLDTPVYLRERTAVHMVTTHSLFVRSNASDRPPTKRDQHTLIVRSFVRSHNRSTNQPINQPTDVLLSRSPPGPKDGDGPQAEPAGRKDVAVAEDVLKAARLHKGVGEEEDDAGHGVEDHLFGVRVSVGGFEVGCESGWLRRR